MMVSVLNSLQHSETVKCVVLQSKGPLKQAVSRECDILDLKTKSARSALFKLARTFKTEQPDIVISTMAYFNFVVMLALLMSGHKPQTIALREANTPSSTLKSTSIGWLYRLFYRLLYNRANVVICNSNQVRAELIDLRVNPKKFSSFLILSMYIPSEKWQTALCIFPHSKPLLCLYLFLLAVSLTKKVWIGLSTG